MGSSIDTKIHRCEYKLNTWVFTIVEWYVVAMISRRTSSVPKEDDVSRRLLHCESRCTQTCRRCTQVCRRCTQVCRRCTQVCCRCTQVCRRRTQVCRRRTQVCRRRTQVCRRRTQVFPGLSSALPGLLLAFPVTLKAGRNALLGSDPLLKLTHLSLHSTSSQTLLEASSD